MATWKQVTETAPDFAATVQARFAVDKHAVLATLRKDGSPRVSGIETTFHDELWLGGMPRARKSADLRRDPRFALHSFTSSRIMESGDGGGDAKISGRALAVTDPAVFEAYLAGARERGDYVPPDLDFDLFRVDVEEVVTISVEGGELVAVSWRPGRPLDRRARK